MVKTATPPLADTPPLKDPIPETPSTTPPGVWDALYQSASKVEGPATRGGRPRVTEDDIPEAIRAMVERAYKENEYFGIRIEDEKIRDEFIKYIRKYAYIRRAGRLTTRVYLDGDVVKYSAVTFKPREKKSDK